MTTPARGDAAIEIPAQTKKRLGLDEDRSWIMLTEANRFVWPALIYALQHLAISDVVARTE